MKTALLTLAPFQRQLSAYSTLHPFDTALRLEGAHSLQELHSYKVCWAAELTRQLVRLASHMHLGMLFVRHFSDVSQTTAESASREWVMPANEQVQCQPPQPHPASQHDLIAKLLLFTYAFSNCRES